MSVAIKAEIRKLEDQRFQAMVDSDFNTLEKLLGDQKTRAPSECRPERVVFDIRDGVVPQLLHIEARTMGHFDDPFGERGSNKRFHRRLGFIDLKFGLSVVKRLRDRLGLFGVEAGFSEEGSYRHGGRGQRPPELYFPVRDEINGGHHDPRQQNINALIGKRDVLRANHAGNS